MSLDPMPDAATLLRMKAEREGRSRNKTFGHAPAALAVVRTDNSCASSTLVECRFEGPLLLPVRLRIPWSCLISDNAMYVVDKRTGKRHKTAEYKAAQKRIKALATDVMEGRPPAECPLSIYGRFWLPNNHRRDVINFGAALADSLKGVVFMDDTWLYRATWERIAVDVDAPRCELTISPLTPTE